MGDSHDAGEVCSKQLLVDAPDAVGCTTKRGEAIRPRKAKKWDKGGVKEHEK